MVCKYLSFDSTVSDYQLLQGVAQAAKVYYNYTGSSPCLNTSQTATSSLGYLGWFYQVHKTARDSVMLNKSVHTGVSGQLFLSQ